MVNHVEEEQVKSIDGKAPLAEVKDDDWKGKQQSVEEQATETTAKALQVEDDGLPSKKKLPEWTPSTEGKAPIAVVKEVHQKAKEQSGEKEIPQTIVNAVQVEDNQQPSKKSPPQEALKGKRKRDEKYVAPIRQQPRKKPRLVPTRSFFSRVVFFGTSSASPLPGVRNVSSLGIQLDSGDIFIVDCGEGTQCQLMRSTLKTSRIKAILFTHLHGDHCYGIFGLIKMLSHNGRKEPLWIVGPVGIKRMILTVLYCSGGWNVDEGGRFRLVFHELPTRNKQVVKLEDTDQYLPGLTIHCAPMCHLCMPTYGYVIHESNKQGKLDGKKARELGAAGKQLGMLKDGKDVTLENGVVIKSADVLGIPLKPRCVAILLDTSDASSALDLCQGVDLLIHEATYDDTFREKAVAHGHSTGVMAAEFANRCGAKRLVLTHFSCRYRSCGTPGLPQVTDLEKEASNVAKCPVTAACDFKSFSGKPFVPDEMLALQHKELLVLQARKKYGHIEGLTVNQESKDLSKKEDLPSVSTMTAKVISTEKSLMAAKAEAGVNGEKMKLEIRQDGAMMENKDQIAEAAS